MDKLDTLLEKLDDARQACIEELRVGLTRENFSKALTTYLPKIVGSDVKVKDSGWSGTLRISSPSYKTA